jgi:hypothetical protein
LYFFNSAMSSSSSQTLLADDLLINGLKEFWNTTDKNMEAFTALDSYLSAITDDALPLKERVRALRLATADNIVP